MEGGNGLSKPPTYTIASLRALRQAFNANWVEVQARDPFRDFERDLELKTAINQKLCALARDGVTDPVELREWALEGLRLR
jgi:hypothetical protein